MLILDTEEVFGDPLMDLSAYSIQGKRNHMEDFFDIGYLMKLPEARKPDDWPFEFFYFGIFDGHGGHEASQYAKNNLCRNIVSLNDFWSDRDEDVMRAIRRGFEITHQEMRQALPRWARTSKTLPSTAGTTASILFIRNGKYYTGHVGDSRIVITQENPETKQWIAHQLTEDHKPESEIDRIERAGGQVKEKTGVQRVVWKRPVLGKSYEADLSRGEFSREYRKVVTQMPNYPIDESLVACYQFIPFLAIARSLGDFWSINPTTGLFVVSPEPDVSCRPISANDTGILLATDGLWNIMDAMKAVRIMQELEMKSSPELSEHNKKEHFITDNFYDVGGEEGSAAQSLVYFAYQIWERKRARSDNITVVFARLWDILPRLAKPNKTYPTRLSLLQSSQPRWKRLGHLYKQIKTTNVYSETIYQNCEPTFEAYERDSVIYTKAHIENQMMLPPTIVDTSIDLIPPKNYHLLSEAPDREIPYFEESGYYKHHPLYVRVKNVSDDPADYVKNESYLNKKGTRVRDSSCQISDWLHDFGQPWDQLQGQMNEDEDLDIEEYDVDLVRGPKGVEIYLNRVFGPGWEEEGDEEKMVEDEERTEQADIEEEEEDEDKIDKDSNENRDNSMKQLRCLLNYTPPLRRSKRRIYISMSEDNKKKCQVNKKVDEQVSENKRRKSQPANCNVVQS